MSFVLIIVVILYSYKLHNEKHNYISIWTNTHPYSTDPMEYDASAHHIVFRSIYSSLVSQYKAGEFVPVLAETWKRSNDFKTWTFSLRESLTFANGKVISPLEVYKSFIRVGYLLKQQQSHSEFYNNLFEFNKLKAMSDAFAGITLDGNKLTFKFIKPMQEFLEILSFGLYAITDSNDYDEKTGAWKNNRSINGSGPYVIKSWDENLISLESRDNFLNHLWHQKKFKEVNFVFRTEDRGSADAAVGASTENYNLKTYEFTGRVVDSMSYIFCLSWKVKSTICSDKSVRTVLRDKYYATLKSNQKTYSTSFFPPGLTGVHEFGYDINSNVSKNINIKIPVKWRDIINFNDIYLNFRKYFTDILNQNAIPNKPQVMTYQNFNKIVQRNFQAPDVDFAIMETGILLNNPIEDLRFMFLSKQGINLPDPTGKIHEELKKENPDIQKINEILFDDAIIWPLGHFAYGLWVKDFIDTTMINNLLPPTELQWLGSK